jgi:trehalose/maltose transport system substrate-binding protein
MPFNTELGVLYYRADLLQKYGYRNPPATWDELEKMAARIQAGERAGGNNNFWGYVWQGAAYEGLTCNAFEWQASYGGGSIIEPNGSITVNNPRTIEAMKRARRWIGTISPPSVIAFKEQDSRNVLHSGDAAFARDWLWRQFSGVADPESYGKDCNRAAAQRAGWQGVDTRRTVSGSFNVFAPPSGGCGAG